jgi:hypothetical protein
MIFSSCPAPPPGGAGTSSPANTGIFPSQSPTLNGGTNLNFVIPTGAKRRGGTCSLLVAERNPEGYFVHDAFGLPESETAGPSPALPRISC